MKKMKKIFALLIAMVMVLGMSTSVFAADDGSITIQNTVKDKEYNIYKVFDATYSGTNVSYTYDGSNATFLAALQAESSPFTTTANTAGSYNVVRKESANDAAVLDFIKGQAANFGSAVKTLTGDGKTQTASGLGYGYYYITTTTGTNVTIDSALKDVTVIDKNEVIPPPDKAEQVANGTWTTEPESGNESTTGNIGDTVNYKVTGSFNRYQGEELVTKITFSDTMSEGLTPNKDVVIKINGTEVSVTPTYTNNDRTWTAEITTATVADDGTITFNYDTPSTYEITYSAVINENAKIADPENNTFTLKYNDKGDQSDITEVVTYQITLTKVDKDGNKLAGAKFKLYDAETGGNEIPVVLVPQVVAEGETADANYGTKDSTVDNVYRHAKTNETGVEMVTGKTGVIVVKGLANGTYYFEETEAPEGFNKLTARTDATTITDANATISVLNQSGTELPSTGGIGTTIFYIIGAILVIGAGVVLVTRRRMNVQ